MADYLMNWDAQGEHYYSTGVDRGVFYDYDTTNGTYHPGVEWNGLTAVNENPSGAEPNAQYADNIKYLNLISAEEYGFTIEAFSSPEEFDKCDGTIATNGVRYRQQKRAMFGFSYRTKIGSDVDDDLGYVIHLVYGCKAKPSAQNHETVNDSPEASTLSWEVDTTPIADPDTVNHTLKPLSVIEIDSRNVNAAKLTTFEQILYGTPGDSSATPAVDPVPARLPLPSEVISHFAQG